MYSWTIHISTFVAIAIIYIYIYIYIYICRDNSLTQFIQSGYSQPYNGVSSRQIYSTEYIQWKSTGKEYPVRCKAS